MAEAPEASDDSGPEPLAESSPAAVALALGRTSKANAEADKTAPRWGRNHLRWGQALARLGKTDEARAQWRAAAAMDLSAADAAALQGLLKNR